LTSQYKDQQVVRTLEVLQKINERGDAVASGRVVPDDESIPIGQGRRLEMAVMFVDVCSFSQRPSETPDEQSSLLQVLTLFFTELIRIAEEYGGTVEKNTGDGLMAYFEDGGGTPPEAGCTRAVAAALSMFHAAGSLINPVLQRSGIRPLQFRVGIDYGKVTVAKVGVAKRFNSLVAIGTCANVACKILGFAEPDNIVIGESVCLRLPAEWRRFCELSTISSGWVYRRTGFPYPLYRYTGRWISPGI
jgi:class 3 adenylate cyclase